MTLKELEAYAYIKYGTNWTGPLARQLNINRRTVARWKAGQNTIPDWVRSELDNPRGNGGK